MSSELSSEFSTPLNSLHELDTFSQSSSHIHSSSSTTSWGSNSTPIVHESPSHNARRSHPSFALSPLSQTPKDLLRNDWFLDQILKTSLVLFKPGSLGGVHISTGALESFDQSLSVLNVFAQDHLPAPLLYHARSHISCGNNCQIRSRPPGKRPPFRLRHSEPLLHDMPPKRKAKAAADGTSPAKMKRSAGRIDLLHNEKHAFSAKSKLAQQDLTSLFVHPEAWTKLTDEEQSTIRSLMPAHMIYTDDGAPDPHFLRYDNDWRNALRLFSEDVQAGRYESEWLEEAREAAEMRRRGDFDEWKEQQFEEFWGQKSESYASMLAGEASKLRLGELIQEGVFRVGDDFVYTRTFGKGKDERYLVEKDCTVVRISGKTLSFTMPPGQKRKAPAVASPQAKSARKFPPRTLSRTPERFRKSPALPMNDDSSTKPEAQDTTIENAGSAAHLIPPSPCHSSRSTSPRPTLLGQTSQSESQRSSSAGYEHDTEGKRTNKKGFGTLLETMKRSSASDKGTSPNPRRKATPSPKLEITGNPPDIINHGDSYSPLSSLDESEFAFPQFDTDKSLPELPQGDEELQSIETRVTENGDANGTANGDFDEPSQAQLIAKMLPVSSTLVTIEDVDSLGPLEKKILEVDGRMKGDPRSIPWKIFRCRRGDQDLGTLWDIREAHYKKKHG